MRTGDADRQIRHLRTLGALSIAVPLAVGAAFGLYRFDQAEKEARRQVERSSRVVTESAMKVLVAAESAARRARELARGKSPSDLMAGRARLREALAEIAKDQPQVLAILIVGPDGQILVSSRAGQLPTLPVADRDYFKAQLGGAVDEPFLSEPLVSRGAGERAMDLSLRFEGPDGEFGGVVDVSAKASYFESFYSDLASGQPGLAVAALSSTGAQRRSSVPSDLRAIVDLRVRRRCRRLCDERQSRLANGAGAIRG